MVASVSEARIEFGVRLLRGSMKALEIHYANGSGFRSSLLIPPQAASLDGDPGATSHGCEFGAAASESLMATQRYIDRQESVNGNRKLLEWYGCKTSPSGGMEFGQVGTDLYHGSSGILIAMRLLGCDGIDDLVTRAVRSAISELNRDITKLGGSYIGLASAVLPLYALSIERSDVLSTDLTAAAKSKFESAVQSRHPMQYFIGSDLICGVAGALNVAGIMYAATGDSEWRELADGVSAILLAQVRETDGTLVIPNGKSVSAEKDGCLTGLSHGQIGIALALANYVRRCEPTRSEQVTELVDALTRWELSKYSAQEANWPDYRMRSGADSEVRFEFGWSHGAPGIYLALTQLAASNCAARRFIEAVPYSMIVETALRRRRSPVNVTICHGALGAVNLSRRLLSLQNDASLVAAHVEELIAWSRLAEFVQMDEEEFNLTEFDMPGLWTGRAGAALGYGCLARDGLSVPFLIEDTLELLNMECEYVD
jgi:lantibiotic modifying enzyme